MQNLCARAHVHKAQAQGAGSLSEGQSLIPRPLAPSWHDVNAVGDSLDPVRH